MAVIIELGGSEATYIAGIGWTSEEAFLRSLLNSMIVPSDSPSIPDIEAEAARLARDRLGAKIITKILPAETVPGKVY